MADIAVLDNYGLALPAIVDVGLTAIFAISGFIWRRDVDKVVAFGVPMIGFGTTLSAVFQGSFYDRDLIIMIFLLVWLVWQFSFLLYKAMKRGPDPRFDAVKTQLTKFSVMWIVIAVFAWTQLLPFILYHSPIVGNEGGSGAFQEFEHPTDYAGVAILAFGTILNVTSDLHKYIWQSRHRHGIMNQGAWALCRHPSYLGHVLMMWGVWIMAITVAIYEDDTFDSRARAAVWASVVGPIFLTFFTIFVLIPTAENAAARKHYLHSHGALGDNWRMYQRYVEGTSPLIPFPPPLYRRLPQGVKHFVFFDLPLNRFDEQTDGHKLTDDSRSRSSANVE
ncbi:hypothetical protein OIO90_004696 [Microbotryomycetes sp. JL221]|nr:hypothetical protein OIO90_004696 [Microbotryomycetes sp. JL221]